MKPLVAGGWWQQYRVPGFAAFTVNLLAFGYLFCTYIYSNHLFPNILDNGLPSFRTKLEGRWGADLVYFLQGGRAIPLLDLMLAVPVQIANGILFARLLDVRDPFRVFLAATLISVHPFVSDYYGFAGDHLVLVLGDTFILLAFRVIQRTHARWSIPVAAFLFQAALSCYQPKIGLIATLWELVLLGRLAAWNGTIATLRRDAREMLLHGMGIIAGAALYLVLLKLSQWWISDPAANTLHATMRISTIGLSEVAPQARRVLKLAYQALFEADFLGSTLSNLQGLLLLLFILAVIIRAYCQAKPRTLAFAAVALIVLVLCLLPFALYGPFVISRNTYVAGRILMPIAYLTAFLILMLLTPGLTRIIHWPVIIFALFLCYRFVLINAEVGHLAQLRTTYEFHFVNRLTSRIEQIIPPTPRERFALVIIGRPPIPHVLTPSIRTHSNLSNEGFAYYRSVEMLNFFLGKDLLIYPNETQVRRALGYADGHITWPGEKSVTIVDDELIVVVLEQPYEGVMTTMIGGL